jgi:cobalt-zinc-cadmium efflux system membrane fusion protein
MRTLGSRERMVIAVLASMAACGPADVPVEDVGLGSVVVTQWNDSTELFLEYPHLVAGTPTGNWAIHLTDRTDFKPIRSGTLSVRFTSPEGADAESFTVEAPARDGIFLLDPAIARAGVYAVELELSSPQAMSRHVLQAVEVYATEDRAPREEAEEEAGTIGFLKEQQWVIPFDVGPASDGEVQRTLALPAEIVAPDGALFQVSAPVDGIAPADANRTAPSVGARVQAGQELAALAPSTEQGGFAEARGRAERLEVEVARAERLAEAGAIARRRLEDARRELEIARAELEAMGGATSGDYLLRLRSPVTGVVATRDFVPGGRVTAGTPLFTVVDPSAAWLRVQVPVGEVASLGDGAARFTLEGAEEIHAAPRRLSVGRVVDPGTRTVPVVYQTSPQESPLSFGQIATARVPVGDAERGIVIPRSAVLDEGGASVAYVQMGGESFERRVLTLGATDGALVVVQAGVEAGEMVVTLGAYQVRLASLSGNEFAGAHAH